LVHAIEKVVGVVGLSVTLLLFVGHIASTGGL
jgi:hypothetical protein